MAVVTVYKVVLVHDTLAHFRVSVEFSSTDHNLSVEAQWKRALQLMSSGLVPARFKLESAVPIGSA